MQIKELVEKLNPVNVNYCGKENIEVKNIAQDSRNPKGTVFFAYKGESYDSNKDAENIYKSGQAEFIICEEDLGDNIAHAVIKNGRQLLPKAVSAFYDEPMKKYRSMAVTGTNGKTTSTYIMESIFHEAGMKTCRIGTTGIMIDDEFVEIDNTTPSPELVYSSLARGLEKGCTALTMEVSSHALAQGRINGAFFETAVFTNLTGDHLDFHKNMENYFEAKALLFTDTYSKHRVINISHEYGKKLAGLIKENLITFNAFDNDADIFPVKYTSTVHGIDAEISVFGKIINIHSMLIGEYNLENILGAVGAAYSLGISLENIVNGIKKLKNVPGRLEKFSNKNITAFVDYAHTDDALVNAISSLRQVAKGRIITVFGAGGDRDATKRPRMAKASTELSDITIITSDNPRTEDPLKIIDDILKGVVQGKEYYVEPDREKAIAKAVSIAKEHDIIFIAGKGHEDYQIIGKTKHHFDDRLVVQKYLGAL